MAQTMAHAKLALLSDRTTVYVHGSDAEKFLQGLVTNDVTSLEPVFRPNQSVFSGLLSPQGKILFDFIIYRRSQEQFMLDVDASMSDALVKRLTLYKLRSAVFIHSQASDNRVYAHWHAPMPDGGAVTHGPDPRHPHMGSRIYGREEAELMILSASASEMVTVDEYHAHRIALGVPEGGKDYEFGDTYPHEAGFDLFNGVSFKKGCYVGQEVVSRMQHKTVVRKRVVRIEGERDLTSGSDITHNGVVFGRVGSTDGRHALALLKLDRYAEAKAAGDSVLSGDIPIRVHDADFERYLASVKARETKP